MKAFLSVAFVAVVVVAADDDTLKKEKDALQGKWAVLSVERDGKPVETWTDGVRTMEGNNYTLTPKKGESVKGTFTLDPSKTPKAIDFLPSSGQYKDKTLRGIYEIDGDMLRICFAEPDKARPAEFSSKADSGWTLAMHKKQK